MILWRGHALGAAALSYDDAHLATIAAFGGVSGDPLSKPFAMEIRGDGTTMPTMVELAPAAKGQ